MTMWQLYRKEAQQLATLRSQNAVVTHSAHMQQELAANGVSAVVIPYAVTIPDAEGDPNAAKSCDLLFAGRMDRLKGGMLLLDAVQLMQARLERPLRVTFAGDGPDRPRWEARAREIVDRSSGITILFTGWCDEARLGMLMRESRLLVVPSVWPEPFGSVGMGAARYGVPSAAFAVGGISQWLHEGVNGHLAPGAPPTAAGLAGAVVRCLGDARHYDDLSRGARRVAATFTMENHLPELIRVLEHAIDGPR